MEERKCESGIWFEGLGPKMTSLQTPKTHQDKKKIAGTHITTVPYYTTVLLEVFI